MGCNVLDDVPWVICCKVIWLRFYGAKELFDRFLTTCDKGWCAFV